MKVGIKYTPHPLMLRFHNERLKYFIRALVTGYGGGKTYSGCMELLQISAINKGVPNVYIEPTNQMIKDILQPQLKEILEDNNIPYNLNKSEHNFYLPMWNGLIWLRSGDKPDKLKGINAGVIGIDEPFIQNEDIFKIAISRARHPEAKVKGVFLTGTPEQLNWGYELLEAERKDVMKYQGTTYDNLKYLGQDYVNNMLNHYSEKEVEAYVNGKFVNLTTGQSYYAFSEDNIISEYNEETKHTKDNEFKYLDYRPLEISCDFNIDLMCWNISQTIHGVEYIFDFIELENTANTEQMCFNLKNKFPNHPSELFYFYGDISGGARRPEASRTNWAIIREHFPYTQDIHYQNIKNIKDRIDATNGRLKNSKGEVKVKITKNCTRLIKDFRQVTWEMLLNKAKAGKLTHASDGFSYQLFWKYPLTPKTRVRIS